jgi:osmotically-inducible protein OsmY
MTYSFALTLKIIKERPLLRGHAAAIFARRVFTRRVTKLYLGAVLSLTLVAAVGALAPSHGNEVPDAAARSPDATAERAPNAGQDASAQSTTTAYIWSASRSGSILRLRGLVPSEEDRKTVLGMVKAHFADLEVEDRLKVADGAPPREQWLGAVSFGLKQLSHLKQGSARLLNEGLKVDGEARSAADYAEVTKALSGPVPTGLTVLNDHVRPPLADPFVFAASLGPNALVLTGSVPSEDDRKDLKELARRFFERPMLDDQLQVASGAPKDWSNAVEAALKALSRLDSGKIALSGREVTIEGLAPDKSTAAVVSYQLKHDLPPLFSSSESIKWKEADVSGNVGELIAPRIKEMIDADTGTTTGALPSAELKVKHSSD